MFSFLLGIYLKMELLGHMVSIYLGFWQMGTLFFNVSAPFKFPSVVLEGSNFSKSSPSLVIFYIFKLL